MKTSTDRILTTHAGSLPRLDSVRMLIRTRLAGGRVDDATLTAASDAAVAPAVGGQRSGRCRVLSGRRWPATGA